MLLPGSEARSVPSRKVRGQADTGGNMSLLQSVPPSIPVHLHSSTCSLSLSLSLSHTHTHTHIHTHTHTHTHTDLPKGKKPALRVQTPDPEGSSCQGCSQQMEGLRFPKPALLSPASCRAGAPHPGPKFPGSRPHSSFLPRVGGRMGLRLPACPRLLVWMDRPLPAHFPVALGGIHTSSTQPYKSTCSV